MYTIHQLNKISPIGTDIFNKNKYAMAEDIEKADGVLVRSGDMHPLVLPPSLKVIARAGAGVNNIPIDHCSEQGVVVFNTPGANANGVKELTMLGLLLSTRKVVPAIDWARTLDNKGDQVPKLVEKGKSAFAGPELYGKKIGVLGLGAIGIMVANMAIAMGMEVYGYDPFISVDAAWQLSREIKHASTINEVYENCDFITLHLPLNTNTKEMINEETIGIMKKGVRILNFARGELVSDTAILSAIKEKQVCCYVTDFPNDKMLQQDGVIAIPHLGASTPESEDNCAMMAVRQMMDFLENGNIKNAVNYPDITAPRTTGQRICVLHQNIPAMISGISNVVSAENINIENLMNKSKKELAYTMIDVEGEITENTVTNIQQIKGVIRVNTYK